MGAAIGANVNIGVKTSTEDWSGNKTLPSAMDEIRGTRYIADHAAGTLNQAFLNAIQVGFKVV